MQEDQKNTEKFIQKLPYSVIDKIITLKTHWISKNSSKAELKKTGVYEEEKG